MAGYIKTDLSAWLFHLIVLFAAIGGLGGALYGLGKNEKDKESVTYQVSLAFAIILALASGILLTVWFSSLELSRNCVNACNEFASKVISPGGVSPVGVSPIGITPLIISPK